MYGFVSLCKKMPGTVQTASTSFITLSVHKTDTYTFIYTNLRQTMKHNVAQKVTF